MLALPQFSNKQRSVLKLKSLGRRLLYKRYNFYNLKFLGSCGFQLLKNQNSFLGLVLNHYFTYHSNVDSGYQLVRPFVVTVTSFFVYFSSGEKYTILKPKYKPFLPLGVWKVQQKEFLVLSHRGFFNFLPSKVAAGMLQKFILKSLKVKYAPPFSPFYSNNFLFFKKFRLFQLSSYYFFYQLFKPWLSKYQKKINFLQFNIFFKNIIMKLPVRKKYIKD